ncbi:MAG: DegT/DnrJ/EryC1/StrS aminotransferase, partial [Proteobacteria bacterium]|nr:DegT/DnrJ/EryC1/StrS aminotransferase [Pseudomonadota bacterium]
MTMRIPLLRPGLPPLAALAPYIERIDASRMYSNFGPLVRELEARLAARHGLPTTGLVTVTNATLGLTAAMAAQGAPAGSLCLMPAWTFIASPLAALSARLTPFFLDVAADWALHPELVEEALPGLPGPVGAVMPVAPFGQPIDPAGWDAFRARTGMAVVIDAAAGFDAATPGTVPTVVSLHATKALGAGEGGYVMSHDTALIRRVQTYSAFGFYGSRNAQLPGFNAKMSEYSAAVALASLDRWETTRAALVVRAAAYQAGFASSNLVQMQPGFGDRWVANTCVVGLPAGSAEAVTESLTEAGIESRAWWSDGAHRHRATEALPRASLPRTESLAAATLGLPFYTDMPEA